MGTDRNNEHASKTARSAASVVRCLTCRYSLVLATIAALIVVDQLAIQPFISRLGNFAPAINAAGRQRMLSQKLTKAALALQVSKDDTNQQARIRELRDTLDQWSTAHNALREGSSSLRIRTIATSEIENEWRLLEPHFQGMRTAAIEIVHSLNDSKHEQRESATATIVEHERAFLVSMERIVTLMENEATDAVFRLRSYALAISAAVIGLVIALGWFVVRPATRTIRRQVDELENEVARRIGELSTALADLRSEVADREAAESKNQSLAAQLAHAARVATLGHLSAGLAHELNQPLATIANYTEACDVALNRLQIGAPTDRLRKNLERTKQAALRAGQIVRRMRNFVRPDPPTATHIEIDKLIRDVVAFSQIEIDRAAALFTLDLAEERATLSVDPIQIQQVLVNLIQNAIHAVCQCPPGERQIVVCVKAWAAFVQVEVTDSGPGFETSDLESIFAPFYTTKCDGLGIGLSICREIIEKHDGTIWADAAPTRGATVSFKLPRVRNSESNAGTRQAPAECVCS